MKTILAVALGGALGSVMRYGVNIGSVKLLGAGFPWGTLFVNIAGSLAIGVLTEIFAQLWQPSPEIRVFLVTGLLGGFTTFLAFSLDAANLWQGGATAQALTYTFASVVLSIAALFVGLSAVRYLSA